ncbi:hypothetical protein IW261DRAFT_1567200 [Armillaria novae-zelandiae]|uniref:Uncharacterized protein n=1 Tax=Armillaria novae-zelandiae TaxID=153914 RepID=A0AA39UBR7_9AGAR|nr:hypothetical protein IW261DRAFT_1567200 [Armillaria novae-zelandiae]
MGSRDASQSPSAKSPNATCKDIWEASAPPLRNPWPACDELERPSICHTPDPAEPSLASLAHDIKHEMANLNDLLLQFKAAAAAEDDYDPFELDYAYEEPAIVLPMREFWDLVDDIQCRNPHAPTVMSPLNPLRAKAPPNFWSETGALSPLPERRKYHWNIERTHKNETLAIPSLLFRRRCKVIRQCKHCWETRLEKSSLQRYVHGKSLHKKYLKCVGRRDKHGGCGISVSQSPLMRLAQMGT